MVSPSDVTACVNARYFVLCYDITTCVTRSAVFDPAQWSLHARLSQYVAIGPRGLGAEMFYCVSSFRSIL